MDRERNVISWILVAEIELRQATRWCGNGKECTKRNRSMLLDPIEPKRFDVNLR